jgi:hypothetical protein
MVSLLRAFSYVTLFGMTTMNASVVRSRSTPGFPPISSRVLQFAREWANKQDFWSGYCVIQLLPSHSFSKWVDKRQDKISRRFVLHVFRVSRDSQDEACDTEPFGLVPRVFICNVLFNHLSMCWTESDKVLKAL